MKALTVASSLKLLIGTAGGSPAPNTGRCEDLGKRSILDVRFALRAHCGRAARGPSEELELYSERHY